MSVLWRLAVTIGLYAFIFEVLGLLPPHLPAEWLGAFAWLWGWFKLADGVFPVHETIQGLQWCAMAFFFGYLPIWLAEKIASSVSPIQ